MFADSKCGCGTFASRTDQLFCASRTHVTGGKDAFGAGLEVNTGHDKALGI
jgi:hypothetical protein